jgi:hypothetical protein
MVASISSKSSSMSNWADSIYSKLDTKSQGYIEKSDLQDALSKVSGEGGGSGQSVNVDDTFSALDGDSDGKVTKSELTDAMTRLSDQLNAQLSESQMSASRVGRGGPPPEGPSPEGAPPAGQDGGDASGSTGAASGTSTDYIAAADTDGDGTVSDAEQAAYDKKVASEKADSRGSTGAASGTHMPEHQKDPMRDLAHALHLLKAYAENSGGSDATAASTSATDVSAISSSVSFEA